jgi:PAS domain S-box-containing protein
MNQENDIKNRPLPIDQEVVWDKNQTIMSKTDLYGTIEYANDVFTSVCGYEDFELMGQPHNFIRHPDMPKIIFKVMWENIKEGNQFHGIVKNMARSGKYYWVITNFEYLRDENGKITKYIAKRKAVPALVIKNHIEPLYKKLLKIEETSGIEISEKYLVGYLEDIGLSYVDLITKLMIDNEKEELENIAESKEIEEGKDKKRGFFSRFFGD